ncbi:hypothetical protein IscW_ISCW010949 [Ixodes scapularis]|uniref:Uncharacterized protein n=1 Tax=Ixodes scapularis TaxID=6945 RepID=B7Q8B4_IXOSC|nr:hypothetical protein IscW_ISCW010949 [Ixodes scapularis]|eukprot:XP_002404907.1 hypothetical protein IscW_ISCW010949 [Ixodes scapularis]
MHADANSTAPQCFHGTTAQFRFTRGYTDRNLSCVAGNKNTFWDILKGNLHEASKWQPPFMKCQLPLLGLQTWAHRDSMDYPKASNEHTRPFRSHHPFYLLEQNASFPSTQFCGKPGILCCFQ